MSYKEKALENQRYFDSYISKTYPTKGRPDCLQTFHHHIQNRQQVTGQCIALILNDLLKVQARCKRAGLDVDALIDSINESCRIMERPSTGIAAPLLAGRHDGEKAV